MAIKYEHEDEPMNAMVRVLSEAKPRTVHEMGVEMDRSYSRVKAVELDRFMTARGWNNGEQTAAMLAVLAHAVSKMPNVSSMRESLVVAMTAHLWAMISTMDETEPRTQETERAYFLFESSERATVFAERLAHYLSGDLVSHPLTTRVVGPLVQVQCELFKSAEFRTDVETAARVMRGDPITKTQFEGRH